MRTSNGLRPSPAGGVAGSAPEHLNPRLAEGALVGIAAVWGLTFVMVQDAIAELPSMAFLAYRFIPAGLIVALLFRRSLAQLPPEGWRAGLVMGAFLTAGYVFQTVGLEYTSARMPASSPACSWSSRRSSPGSCSACGRAGRPGPRRWCRRSGCCC